MNHQPFEQWILDPANLSDADRQDLQQHLAGCKSCRLLQEKWVALNEELRTPLVLAPKPGFTRRWRDSQAERRQRDQRRQAWRYFMAFSGATAAVFLIMVVYLLFTSTPAEWIQAAVRTLSTSLGIFSAARDLTTTWLSLTPMSLNVVVWIALGVTFSILAVIWVFAIWKTAFAGVGNK